MKKRLKKLVVLGVTATMIASSSLSVSAAGLRDVFDARYYADTYKDLKEAFGDDEELLYQHFVENGLKENRQMSQIIDIQAYRAAYPDLEEAFGDNWDAYVDHFFDNGAKEGRTQGVLFNPVKYAEAYPDIAAAFGDDYRAVAGHFLTNGKAEGRTAGVVAKAQPAPARSGGGSSSTSTTTTTDDGKTYDKTKFPDKGEAGKDLADTSIKVTTVAAVSSVVTQPEKPNESGAVAVEVNASVADTVSSGLATKLGETLAKGAVVTVPLNVAVSTDGEKTKVKNVSVSIPQTVVAALKAKDTEAHPVAVAVQSDIGTFTVPVDAFKNAAGAVKLEVEKKTATTVEKAGGVLKDSKGFVVDDSKSVVMDVKLMDGANPINVADLTDKIQVSIATSTFAKDAMVNVYFVKAGALELVGKPVKVGDGGKIEFSVDHLTEFVIAQGKHVKEGLTAAEHTYDMFAKVGEDTTCMYCEMTLETFQTGCKDAEDHKVKEYVSEEANAYGFCQTCGKAKEHEHTGVVKFDKNKHWTECSAKGCPQKTEGTAHEFQSGKCKNEGCGATVSPDNCPNKAANHKPNTTCATCGLVTDPATGGEEVNPNPAKPTVSHGEVKDEYVATHTKSDFRDKADGDKVVGTCTGDKCSITLSDYQAWHAKQENAHEASGVCETCGLYVPVVANHVNDNASKHTVENFADKNADLKTVTATAPCKDAAGGCTYTFSKWQTAHADVEGEHVAKDTETTCKVCGGEIKAKEEEPPAEEKEPIEVAVTAKGGIAVMTVSSGNVSDEDEKNGMTIDASKTADAADGISLTVEQGAIALLKDKTITVSGADIKIEVPVAMLAEASKDNDVTVEIKKSAELLKDVTLSGGDPLEVITTDETAVRVSISVAVDGTAVKDEILEKNKITVFIGGPADATKVKVYTTKGAAEGSSEATLADVTLGNGDFKDGVVKFGAAAVGIYIIDKDESEPATTPGS